MKYPDRDTILYGRPIRQRDYRLPCPPAAIHSSGGIHNGDPLQDPCRYAYLQPVNIAADGSPVLNMTPEQELADEYKKCIHHHHGQRVPSGEDPDRH